jgi:opacity protein-like surface antigen
MLICTRTEFLSNTQISLAGFVNAHFKPFAAIGYEYNKVKANTGNAQWSGTVQFSIPQ